MKRTQWISLLLFATFMVAIPAGANVLPPSGGSGAPDSFGFTLGAQLANAQDFFTLSSVDNNGNPVVATGRWVAQVFRDSVTGNLDFIYGIQNNSSSQDIIELLTMSNFKGFVTDVGIMAGCWTGAGFVCSPSAVPATVGRAGLGGSNITFSNFTSFGTTSGIAPGSETGILVIETNAKYFTKGQFAIQDGTNLTFGAFAPTNVPEPASLLLFGSGLVGLGNLVRRKLAL